MTTRNIELRKISHSASLSEETNAYTADLYVDGKLLAHVSNHGHGGCDMQHPAKGRTHAEIDELNAHIKATYPPKDTGMMLEGKPFIMEQDLETICGDLLTDHLLTKDLQRTLKRTVAFYDPTKKAILTYKGKHDATSQARLCEITAQKHPQAKILNRLPFAEALAIYKTDGKAA